MQEVLQSPAGMAILAANVLLQLTHMTPGQLALANTLGSLANQTMMLL